MPDNHKELKERLRREEGFHRLRGRAETASLLLEAADLIESLERERDEAQEGLTEQKLAVRQKIDALVEEIDSAKDERDRCREALRLVLGTCQEVAHEVEDPLQACAEIEQTVQAALQHAQEQVGEKQ